ncbi:hypothetical protein TNIN_479741 [Trichonephila inaurata madagascariensis]|uniref:Uncharacterized protein n=1 Tax=Trichonephila inaurata madagascariensis TaxID=2747483 RepID=A0A8X6XU54_9ARAC|nr:hypothetical protein TNIN_479741 [Trichonephila inaurata madagascariensis]
MVQNSVLNGMFSHIVSFDLNTTYRHTAAYRSATLVFGYHLDLAKTRILTQDEIDRYMNNTDELSEDGLKYSDDDVDFYLIVM